MIVKGATTIGRRAGQRAIDRLTLEIDLAWRPGPQGAQASAPLID